MSNCSIASGGSALFPFGCHVSVRDTNRSEEFARFRLILIKPSHYATMDI